MHTDPNLQSANPEFLFKAYYGRLCYYAFQFIKDRSMAEDVAQDAFVAYWNNRFSVAKHDKAIKDYLYTSVRNSCLNLLRREKVMDRYLNSRSPEDYSEDKLFYSLIEAEVIDALHKAINTFAHEQEWIRASKESAGNRTVASSHFGFSGPFNEMVVMGVLAVRLQGLNRNLLWDGKNMHFTNISDSDKISIVTLDDFVVTDGHPRFNRESQDFNAREMAQEWIKHTYHNGFTLPEMPA